MKTSILFWTILKKSIIIKLRYKFEFFTAVVSLSLMFLGMMFGAETLSNSPLSATSKVGMLSGYILWTIMLTSYGNISGRIIDESISGTFIQLYINSKSLLTTLFFNCIASFITSLATIYSIIVVTSLVSGISLSLQVFKILPVVILGIPAIWGLGLVIGSLTLSFKKVQSMSSIISMFVLGSIPFIVNKNVIAATLLPFGMSTKIAMDIFNFRRGIFDISMNEVLIILAGNVVYLAFGYVSYIICMGIAKKHGRLTQF